MKPWARLAVLGCGLWLVICTLVLLLELSLLPQPRDRAPYPAELELFFVSTEVPLFQPRPSNRTEAQMPALQPATPAQAIPGSLPSPPELTNEFAGLEAPAKTSQSYYVITLDGDRIVLLAAFPALLILVGTLLIGRAVSRPDERL
ncbi:MAG: hypothetical protein AB9869_01440 [Verrucomicrobiia bacterium]